MRPRQNVKTDVKTHFIPCTLDDPIQTYSRHVVLNFYTTSINSYVSSHPSALGDCQYSKATQYQGLVVHGLGLGGILDPRGGTTDTGLGSDKSPQHFAAVFTTRLDSVFEYQPRQ